ncbi:hypothetical protein KZP23_02665 [Echinicola marina]|uniref:hypothetical protein n=1 Tax=Echinicola marina TaxID=2859768 RepID=UPI001CF6DFC2|nr:hypothetical protein [Echinicola marina]UCS93956.1 hypothetical protein KZP23_02665 [Echinicola marina]
MLRYTVTHFIADFFDSHMEKKDLDLIKVKLCLIVYECLYQNKLHYRKNSNLNVYNESSLASELGVRKATVTDILYCKSLPSTKTIFLIMEAFKLSFSEFASKFEAISEKEALSHAKNILKKMDELKSL